MLIAKQNNKRDLVIKAEIVDIVPISRNKVKAHIFFIDQKELAKAICFSLDNLEIRALIKRLKKHIGDKSC